MRQCILEILSHAWYKRALTDLTLLCKHGWKNAQFQMSLKAQSNTCHIETNVKGSDSDSLFITLHCGRTAKVSFMAFVCVFLL